MVYGDYGGVVEDAHGQGRDDIGRKPVEPPDAGGLAAPEILVGVGGDFFQLLHLGGAPGQAIAGIVQFSYNGAVHLGVVAHGDAGILRQVFRAYHGDFGVDEPDGPTDGQKQRAAVFAFGHEYRFL